MYLPQLLGDSMDGILDKMIIYTINRGAITRSILLAITCGSLKCILFCQFRGVVERDLGSYSA
jgi:hypothetical protein